MPESARAGRKWKACTLYIFAKDRGEMLKSGESLKPKMW